MCYTTLKTMRSIELPSIYMELQIELDKIIAHPSIIDAELGYHLRRVL
jgi:hypothetical protein